MAAKKKTAPKASKTAKKMTKKHPVTKRMAATKKSGTPKVSKAAPKKTTAKTVKRVAKKPAAKKKPVAKKPAAKKKPVARKKAAPTTVKKASSTKQKVVVKKVIPKKAAKKLPAVKKPSVSKKASVSKKPLVAKPSISKKVAPKKKSASKKSAATRTSISKSAPSMVDLVKGNAARKAAARAKIDVRKAPTLIQKSTAKRKKISTAQARTYKATLLRIRDELSRQIAFLRGASLTRADEVNAAEDGSDAFERQLALKLAANENDAVFEIDEALERIKSGDYAICEDCGCIISRARLQALPFARRCVSCKSVSEKTGGYQQRRFF